MSRGFVTECSVHAVSYSWVPWAHIKLITKSYEILVHYKSGHIPAHFGNIKAGSATVPNRPHVHHHSTSGCVRVFCFWRVRAHAYLLYTCNFIHAYLFCQYQNWVLILLLPNMCVVCVRVCACVCVRVRVWSCVYVWTVAVGYAVRKGATNGSLLPKPRIVTTNNLHRGANLKFLSVFPGFFVFLFFFECGRCYSSVTKTIHFERNDLAKLGRKLETNH